MSQTDFSKITLYKGQTFDALLEQIHNNSNSKSDQLFKLIENISRHMTDANSAAVLAPMIAEYFDVAVKNDEQLIKMAAIVQRFFKTATSSEQSSIGISDQEREEILNNAAKFKQDGKIIKMGGM